MGKTKFSRAKKFLEDLKETEGSVIGFQLFREKMEESIGSDEQRTIKPYMRLMINHRLISTEDENVRIN